jgi:putative nucleotidyltransferase with HDIG domain
MDDVQRLVEIIEEIAKGNYSNDIMALTTDDNAKPIRAVAEAMGLMMVKVEAREYQLEMLIDELKALNEKIKQNTIKVVSAMANALAARDTYTEGHAARVGDLACRVARQMGLPEEDVESIRLAGILHDIGKISFSDQLFQQHGQRNPPELVKEIIKHPAVGADILQDLDFLGPAPDYVRYHHERPDGKGYPKRIQGDKVPSGALIVAVADSYDAMTTDRPYQKGKTPEVALEILKKHAGTKWDETCVSALEAVIAAE